MEPKTWAQHSSGHPLEKCYCPSAPLQWHQMRTAHLTSPIRSVPGEERNSITTPHSIKVPQTATPAHARRERDQSACSVHLHGQLVNGAVPHPLPVTTLLRLGLPIEVSCPRAEESAQLSSVTIIVNYGAPHRLLCCCATPLCPLN